MSRPSDRDLRRRERAAAVGIWLAGRASRNRTLLDRLCRRLLDRAFRVPPEDDFMRDPLVDAGIAFDPDELDRYQQGQDLK